MYQFRNGSTFLSLSDFLSYHVLLPGVFELRPQLLVDDDLLHVLQRRMLTDFVLEWQRVVFQRPVDHRTTSQQLPKNQAAGVPEVVVYREDDLFTYL